jgi:hypothetical protein
MLSQLARLSVEADGRYATSEELQFLRDYIESFESRLSAYQKIQAASAEILTQLDAKWAANANMFQQGNSKLNVETCQRDLGNMIRYTATTVLSSDLDRLRESCLLWYQTIVRSYKYGHIAAITYPLLSELVKKYLSAEEAALASPVLGLNQVILGKS